MVPTTGSGLMVTEYPRLTDAPAASVTVTLIAGYAVAVFGVPLITPVLALMDSPVGRPLAVHV